MDHLFVVRGDAVIDAAFQQNLHQLHIIGIDICFLLEGKLWRLFVGSFAQTDTDALCYKLFNIVFATVEVGLDHSAHTSLKSRIPVEPANESQSLIGISRAFHIYTDKVVDLDCMGRQARG